MLETFRNLVISWSINMRISHKYQFLYLAVPRTGSTSVRDALDPISDVKSRYISMVSHEHPYYHHIPYFELVPIFESNGWDIDQYHKFGVVRNPFDRVVSLYHHYCEKGNRWAEGKSFLYNVTRTARFRLLPKDSFEQFVAKLDTSTPMQMSASRFFSDQNGKFSADSVLKFEEVSDGYSRLAHELGFPEDRRQLPMLNRSIDRQSYNTYYKSQEIVDLVSELYADDMSRFGYTYEV